MVRTRIAPSPTGQDVHVGSVATALMNYAWAKKTKADLLSELKTQIKLVLFPVAKKKCLRLWKKSDLKPMNLLLSAVLLNRIANLKDF